MCIRDRANAAQDRHSDPDSEHYVENYNVIAAVNGAGFDMSTGEPSGFLLWKVWNTIPLAKLVL